VAQGKKMEFETRMAQKVRENEWGTSWNKAEGAKIWIGDEFIWKRARWLDGEGQKTRWRAQNASYERHQSSVSGGTNEGIIIRRLEKDSWS